MGERGSAPVVGDPWVIPRKKMKIERRKRTSQPSEETTEKNIENEWNIF